MTWITSTILAVVLTIVTAVQANASCNGPVRHAGESACMVEPFSTDAETMAFTMGVFPFPMPPDDHHRWGPYWDFFSSATGPWEFTKATRSPWTANVMTFAMGPEPTWVNAPGSVRIVEFVDSMPVDSVTNDRFVQVAIAKAVEDPNRFSAMGNASPFGNICPAPPPLCPTCPPWPETANNFWGTTEVVPANNAGAWPMQMAQCRW